MKDETTTDYSYLTEELKALEEYRVKSDKYLASLEKVMTQVDALQETINSVLKELENLQTINK
jgi:uncharacterized coiled-coil DUF342 family protein